MIEVNYYLFDSETFKSMEWVSVFRSFNVSGRQRIRTSKRRYDTRRRDTPGRHRENWTVRGYVSVNRLDSSEWRPNPRPKSRWGPTPLCSWRSRIRIIDVYFSRNSRKKTEDRDQGSHHGNETRTSGFRTESLLELSLEQEMWIKSKPEGKRSRRLYFRQKILRIIKEGL